MKRDVRIQALLLLAISALLLASCGSNLIPLQLEEIESPWLKDSINLRLEVNSATGANGSFASFTTPGYFVLIQGKKVITYLPFYGRVHFTPMLEETGFNMTNGRIENVRCYTHKRKKSIFIKMVVSNFVSKYYFTLEFWEDGSAYLDLNDKDRDKMSYSGFLNPAIHN